MGSPLGSPVDGAPFLARAALEIGTLAGAHPRFDSNFSQETPLILFGRNYQGRWWDQGCERQWRSGLIGCTEGHSYVPTRTAGERLRCKRLQE